MNLKLNNDVRNSSSTLQTQEKLPVLSIKEERQRTGRYIAILVGISLLLLACYHAWVRRIPVVASLVVPALIMFVYVAWVLFTAARDKHKFLNAEAARNAALLEAAENEANDADSSSNVEITVIANREASKRSTPEKSQSHWGEISSTFLKRDHSFNFEDGNRRFIMPIILVNDKPPDDLEQNWIQIDNVTYNEKLKYFPTRRKFRRKFCRKKRYAAFKRSYSIG